MGDVVAYEAAVKCGMCGACDAFPPWAPEALAHATKAERDAVFQDLEEKQARFLAQRRNRIPKSGPDAEPETGDCLSSEGSPASESQHGDKAEGDFFSPSCDDSEVTKDSADLPSVGLAEVDLNQVVEGSEGFRTPNESSEAFDASDPALSAQQGMFEVESSNVDVAPSYDTDKASAQSSESERAQCAQKERESDGDIAGELSSTFFNVDTRQTWSIISGDNPLSNEDWDRQPGMPTEKSENQNAAHTVNIDQRYSVSERTVNDSDKDGSYNRPTCEKDIAASGTLPTEAEIAKNGAMKLSNPSLDCQHKSLGGSFVHEADFPPSLDEDRGSDNLEDSVQSRRSRLSRRNFPEAGSSRYDPDLNDEPETPEPSSPFEVSLKSPNEKTNSCPPEGGSPTCECEVLRKRVEELEIHVDALESALNAKSIASLSQRAKSGRHSSPRWSSNARLREECDSLRLTVDFRKFGIPFSGLPGHVLTCPAA